MAIPFRVLALPILMGILTLIGCGTPKLIVSQWNNPAYSSPSFKRMMIGGLAGETSIRRNFEDEFAAQLRAQGIDALPSYRYIPEAENIDEARLKQAAREAGAEAAIIARSVSVEQKTELGPSYYPTPAFGFFGRHIGATWYGLYGAPSVQRYNVYTSETTLHDIPKNEVVWTATVQTTDPNDVNKAIKNYVAAVIKALEEKNLLGKR